MTINVYQIGALARIEIQFRNLDGDLIDPDGNSLLVTAPDGTTVAYEYGIASEVIRDDVGLYHADIPITQARQWFYRWASTGNGQAAERGELIVEPSDFTVTVVP